MHWISLLRGDELANVKTVSDLYEHVVDRKLEREYEEHPHAFQDDRFVEQERLRVALTRVALIMLAERGTTRITDQYLHKALRAPQGHRYADRSKRS